MAKKNMKKQQKQQKVVNDDDDELVFLWMVLIALISFLLSYIVTTYLIQTTDFENVILMLADKLH